MATRTKLGLDLRYYQGGGALSGKGGDNGALMDLNFVSNSYYVNGIAKDLSSVMSFTRATSAWAFNSAGVLVPFASGQAAIVDKGFLSSSDRVNGLRNSVFTGGVAPSTIPTNYTSINGAGITRTYAYGTLGGIIPYMDVRFSGTSADAVGPDIRFDVPNNIAAANGQTWTQSAYIQIIGGSKTGFTNIALQAFVRDSGAAALVSRVTSITTALSSSVQRFSNVFTIVEPTAAYVQPILALSYNSGTAIDITLRIYLPQLEQGAYASAPILTTNAAVTRNGDVMSLIDPSLFPISGSAYVEFEDLVGANTGISRYFLSKRVDGSNYVRMIMDGTQKARASATIAGSEVVAINPTNSVVQSTIYRQAFGYALNDFASAWTSSLDASIGTDGSGGLLASDGSVGVGHFNGGNQTDGYIRRIVTFSARKTNAELLAWAQGA